MPTQQDLINLKTEENKELKKSDASYDLMEKNATDAYSQAEKDLAATTEDMKNAANATLNQQIKEIEQQKDQTHDDYIKEQSGAYTDWQKQSNQYGVNAEKMATMGVTNSGYSESSQVSMYNTYQNRVATARESFNRAMLNYDNAINNAKIQNSSLLAEIAYNACKDQVTLAIEAVQYKNSILSQKAEAKRQIKSAYANQYIALLNQINAEKERAEKKRQFDAQMAEEKRQFNILHGDSVDSILDIKKTPSNTKTPSQIAKEETGSDNADLLKGVLNAASGTGPAVYSKATKFLSDNGLKQGANRLLTSAEWSKAKRDGILGSELQYPSYNIYVQEYLKWRIQESQ